MSDTAAHAYDEAPEFDYGLVKKVNALDLWDRDRPTRADRWKWWLLGLHKRPPVTRLGTLEDPDPERVGICCSGGGVRSASFNLGALQKIQAEDRLQSATYLSAVSGGSYIAAAFAMVAKTWDPGVPDPPGDDSDPDLVKQAKPPFYPGSPEEQYLRNSVSYMAPSGMGKVRLLWRIVCGLLVNLLLIAAVLALAATALAAYYRFQQPDLVPPNDHGFAADPHQLVVAIALGLAGVGLLLGLASVLVRPRADDASRICEVWSLRLLAVGLVILVAEVVLPSLVAELQNAGVKGSQQPALAGTPGGRLGGGIGAAIVSLLATVLVQIRADIADPKAAVEHAKKAGGGIKKLPPRLRQALIYATAGIVGPLLLVGILVAETLFQVGRHAEGRLLMPGVALAIFVVMNYVVADLTAWSLHPFYRRRLCTAFALRRVHQRDSSGKVVQGDVVGCAVERRTGELVPLSQTRVVPRGNEWKSKKWPTLLVCAAANVSDPGATPPGRGVTSFTFSPCAMGGPLVGGIATEFLEEKLASPLRANRDAADDAGPAPTGWSRGQMIARGLRPRSRVDTRHRDFTLPAVVAMSGAAISPSMGKLTRPSLRFLMGLANLRLGVWVPNPRRLDAFIATRRTLRAEATAVDKLKTCLPLRTLPPKKLKAARNAGSARYAAVPHARPRYLLKELLGWNSINDKFLYVTDGGHYDNLGLVELLRRGCARIYCFDASNGKRFGSLGDAIALARSELGVEITFPDGALDRLADPKSARACATATILYTGATPAEEVRGTLVYVPTVMSAGLPWDVSAFRETDPAFPSDSTMDQLFTDQKFEAYRVLGGHGAAQAVAAMDAATAGDGVAAPSGAPQSPTGGQAHSAVNREGRRRDRHRGERARVGRWLLGLLAR